MRREHLTRAGTPTMRALLIPISLLALGIVPVVAGLVLLAGLVTGQAPAENARFVEHPLPIALHVLAVTPYALLGALQFAPALRRRGWHRAVGMTLVPLGLIAALTGLWMALSYPWPEGDGEAVYVMRLAVGVAMTFAIVRGVASLRRGEYAEHGAWMLRGYALGMGAGTQVLTHLPWFLFVGGAPDEWSRAVMMGLAWVINVVVAEVIIRTGVTAPARVAPPYPGTAGALSQASST
ncbi:MAG: DUF2306 domain-containing protein [Vicinamibacterales bacterium]